MIAEHILAIILVVQSTQHEPLLGTIPPDVPPVLAYTLATETPAATAARKFAFAKRRAEWRRRQRDGIQLVGQTFPVPEAPDPCANARGDLNRDGRIDMIDVGLLIEMVSAGVGPDPKD